MKPASLITLFLTVCALGSVALFLIALRLGPDGYSAHDAQVDRNRLCSALTKRFPDDPFLCPEIQGKI